MAISNLHENQWDSPGESRPTLPPESGVQMRDFRGLWVALTNCTFDPVTKKPVEGDIVDQDRDFSALSERMRKRGLCSCAIVFCDGSLRFESQPPPSLAGEPA